MTEFYEQVFLSKMKASTLDYDKQLPTSEKTLTSLRRCTFVFIIRLKFWVYIFSSAAITVSFQKYNISNKKVHGLKVQVFKKIWPIELLKSVHK